MPLWPALPIPASPALSQGLPEAASCLNGTGGVSCRAMNPLLLFLLLFVGAPLVELYFLIEVGSRIGAIPTIGLTIFTALLGGLLVRMQGLTTAMRVGELLNRGEIPAIEMLEGALLLMAGLMLLLPGFITDALGFLLLIPPLRRNLVLWFLRRSGTLRPGGPPPGAPPSDKGRPRVLEGDYQREDDRE